MGGKPPSTCVMQVRPARCNLKDLNGVTVTSDSDTADSRFWPIAIALMATNFVSSLEVSMIYGALPAVNRIYADPAMTGWLITGFVLVQAVTAAIGGSLGDIYGRRRVLQAALLLSAVGSVLSAFSPGLLAIIAGRCLQGVTGCVLPLSFGIIRQNTSQSRASFGAGLVMGAYAVSGGLGFIVGGYFADIGHWVGIFYISALLPSAAVLLNMRSLPADTVDGTSPKADFVGAIMLAVATASILLGITFGGKLGWLTPRPLGFLITGLLLMPVWVRYELRTPAPLINLRRFADRRLLCSVAAFFFLGCGGMQMAMVILSYMQQPVWTGIGLGLSGSLAGIAKLPGNVAGVVAGPVAGRIAQRWGGRRTGVIGALILTLTWATLLVSDGGLALAIGCAIGSTVGITIMFVGTPAVIMEAVPKGELGQSTGFAYLVRALGMAVGAQSISLLLGTSMITQPGGGASYPSDHAFQLAIAFVTICSLLALVMSWLIPAAKHDDAAETALPA